MTCQNPRVALQLSLQDRSSPRGNGSIAQPDADRREDLRHKRLPPPADYLNGGDAVARLAVGITRTSDDHDFRGGLSLSAAGFPAQAAGEVSRGLRQPSMLSEIAVQAPDSFDFHQGMRCKSSVPADASMSPIETFVVIFVKSRESFG